MTSTPKESGLHTFVTDNVWIIVLALLALLLFRILYLVWNSAPSPGANHNNTEGPWSRRRGYRYPPFSRGIRFSRKQFSAEEQSFVEHFWYKHVFEGACDRAGLVHVIPATDDAPEEIVYPKVRGFDVSKTGVSVSIEGSRAVTPEQINNAQAVLAQGISGNSNLVAVTDRSVCTFSLESRDPLAQSISADTQFGRVQLNDNNVTADDFRRDMEDNDD